MLTKILSFIPFVSKLTGLPSKLIALGTILTVLISFTYWGYDKIYTAGYNEAALEYQTEMVSKVKEEVDKAKLLWKDEHDKIISNLKREKQVEIVTKEVYRDVYHTEYVCEDIGKNALELLNRPLKGD